MGQTAAQGQGIKPLSPPLLENCSRHGWEDVTKVPCLWLFGAEMYKTILSTTVLLTAHCVLQGEKSKHLYFNRKAFTL